MPLDPNLFSLENASPETQSLIAKLEKGPSPSESLPRDLDEIRTWRSKLDARSPLFRTAYTSERAETREIPGPGGPVRLRIVRPERPKGVLLHFHGGGWVWGAAKRNDRFFEHLCDRVGVAVVSVDYRLAPEHPYPAAPDDCEAAAEWLIENAPQELGTAQIAIGGESAGAHLAAVTALRMHRRGYDFCAVHLGYGLFDLAGVPSHTALDGRNLILDSRSIAWFTEQFVPDASRLRDPDVSPLYADLSDLPPALITIGSLDPLLDHSLFLHARWIASGSPSELSVLPGGPHAINFMPTPEGRLAQRRIDRFLASCVG